jgi:hypothetical protein
MACVWQNSKPKSLWFFGSGQESASLRHILQPVRLLSASRALFHRQGEDWTANWDRVDGKFVAGQGWMSMATSTDGASWTPITTITDRLDAIAFGNGRFVAVGVGEISYSSGN